MTPGSSAVEAYLDRQPPDHRELLRDLRARILELAPAARDGISYGMPALTVDGKVLVWFASWARHCSLYPVRPDVIGAHPELAGYGHSTNGALHFSARQPVPDAVLRDVVRRRLAELGSAAR